MTLVFNKKAYGNIKDGISAVATEIELYPGQMGAFVNDIDDWEADTIMYLTITNALAEVEVVKVTAIDGDVFTVERSQDGTVAPADGWPAGAVISQRLTAAVAGSFIQKEGYREVAYDPNGVLAGDYVGEKVYQLQGLWWKNRSGTDWQLIAGSLEGWMAYYYEESYTLYDVCWSPELEIFLAVGNEIILISEDGEEWNDIEKEDLYFTAVCWSPDLALFVAIQTSGGVGVARFYYSLDGVNWPEGTSTSLHGWSSVCWGADVGLFVAVSSGNSSDTENIAVSANGIDWIQYDSPTNHRNLYSVCFSPALDLFVAVGSLISGKSCITSPDGENWTIQALGTACKGVCWSPDLNLFVAVGTNFVATSPDAVTWTPRTAAAAYAWKSVAWSPELELFVAVADESQDFACMTSPTGTTWILRETVHESDEQWKAVCWSPELTKFCAVASGASGIDHCMISSDGGVT